MILDSVIIFLAIYLWYWVMAGVAALAAITVLPKFRAYAKKHLGLLLLALVSASVARFGVAELVRFFYPRSRPFEEGARQLINHAAGGSFPSGHAAFSFAIAAAVYFYYPKMSIF